MVNQEAQPRDLTELAKARSSAALEQREVLDLVNPYACGSDANRLLPEDTFPGFRRWLGECWDACMTLQLPLMASFGEILDATNVEVLVKQQTLASSRTTMGLIHYPSIPYESLGAKKSSRCNAHTDSGQLTLLFQDGEGGLEVNRESCGGSQARFVPVPPRPGAIIMQLGDMLEKQSNGRWRSALHRVSAPQRPLNSNETEGQLLPARHSIAFFVYPDFETVIEGLPGCEEKRQ